MDINSIHNVYLIGIGGIGMSAIARYFKSLNFNVAGYDKTPSPLTEELTDEDIDIHFDDDIQQIPKLYKTDINNTLIIYTPAIPNNHSEYNYFKKNNFQIYKRSKVLGLISNHKKGVAVAGTHGKTTVSTLIAHILKQSKFDCSAFLGGISNNYNSNLLMSDKSNFVVLEADEFDKSFLQLFPYFAVVTSVDADHLDIYGDEKRLRESFVQFIKQIKENGKLLIKKDLNLNYELNKGVKQYTYSLNSKADFYANKICLSNGVYYVDIVTPDEIIKDVEIGMPGLFNVENSIAAFAVSYLLRVEQKDIRAAIANSKGVKRRFNYIIKTNNLVYIDDYAHHPNELKAAISSARELFPDKKITGIFQPHLYSRTRDFASEFAKSLELLDCLIMLDIYPARELPIEGVSSKMILDKVSIENKFLCSKSELIDVLKKQETEVVLTLGAGDIDRLIQPIKKYFETIVND
ncbi:MAG: UDP-N-acetylmuramate--L-alanine ligase [Bacteroidetes bacterium]|nr:MAG: UDP-N-acetylmuramate--L-alanine ligase [Bacteroidota bacterium]